MANTIKLIRGTSNTINITVTDADGNLYTITSGERIIFGVKEKPEDEELLILKISTDCTDGVCAIELDPADTIGLKYGRYVYDVGLESGNEYYSVIPTSPFVVLPNVTKWGDST